MSSLSPTYQSVNGNIIPLRGNVLVINMEKGDKITAGGIITLDDNGKDRGIRPRWCQVYKIGEDINYVQPGQWILVEHGRWTWGLNVTIPEGNPDEIFHVQRIDPKCIMLVTDDRPW